MALADVIDQECNKEVDIKACIDSLEPVFNEQEQEKIIAYFHDTPNQVHAIVTLAQEGKKLYAQLDKLCKKGNLDKRAYVKI